jgi:simple sugar transport system permease protein
MNAPPSVTNNLQGIQGQRVSAILIIPAVTLIVLILLVFILSAQPVKTLYFFFLGPFKNWYTIGNMLNASVPLMLGAIGVTLAVKTGNLNLGGEGQVYAGAFACTITALSLPSLGMAICAGFLAGGALAALCGVFKAKWNTNELISTFLLSYAVIHIVNFLITGPFLDPYTSLQSTAKIDSKLRLTLILPPSSLSSGIFIALAVVIIAHYFLTSTKTGYEFRIQGSNVIFARYGGINTKRNTILAMFLSGACYGLTGSVAVLGTYYAVIKEFSFGLGWNALAVALIAGFYTPAIVPAAVFFAWLSSGGKIAMQNTGLSFEAASVVQAVIFFLSTSLVLRKIFTRGRTPE